MSYHFTNAEYQQFLVWFYEEAAHGAHWFDWIDPKTETSKEARLSNGSIQAQAINARLSDWLVSFTLEVYL